MPLGGALPYDAQGGLDESGLDPDESQVIQALEKIAQREPDNAKSAALTKIVADLYKLLADQEDAEMTAAGGNPKQLRAMGRAYGGAQ